MFILLLFDCFLLFVESRIGCKDLNGRKVDWFVVYKLPAGTKNSDQGKEFIYADANNATWQKSKRLIDDPSTAVGATLVQIYRNDPTTLQFLYSDDGPATKSDGYRGHTKGVLLFDMSTGFWMSHSAPNFPPLASYSYPASATRFAQSFFCFTFPTSSLNDIGQQLRFMQATPFKTQLTKKFATKYPILRQIVAKQSLPKSATIFTSSKRLYTSAGNTIHSFAKHKKFHNDIWQFVVGSELNTDLAIQSWLNGRADDLHTQCSANNKVYDVAEITAAGVNFSSSKDHSKWAISRNSRKALVCIGDMNRQKSQLRRGGGALCIENPELWKSYNSNLIRFEPCASNEVSMPIKADVSGKGPAVIVHGEG